MFDVDGTRRIEDCAEPAALYAQDTVAFEHGQATNLSLGQAKTVGQRVAPMTLKGHKCTSLA